MGNFLYWARWGVQTVVTGYILLSVLNNQEWHPQKWQAKRTTWGVIIYLIVVIYFLHTDMNEGLVLGYSPSLALFILLLIAAAIGIVYRLNQKKIDDKVRSIFSKHKDQK